MKTKEPIVAIMMAGNTKEKVKDCAYTWIACYDSLNKETMVVILAGAVSGKRAERAAKEIYQNYGTIKSVTYYKDGGEIVEMTTSN